MALFTPTGYLIVLLYVIATLFSRFMANRAIPVNIMIISAKPIIIFELILRLLNHFIVYPHVKSCHSFVRIYGFWLKWAILSHSYIITINIENINEFSLKDEVSKKFFIVKPYMPGSPAGE
jgi:hypothetical protein